jgi:heme oxygenase
MMTLPESLSQQFDVELEAFEESKKMKYVSTTQRRLEAKTKAEVEAKKVRSLLQRQLTRRFGGLQASVLEAIEVLTIENLDQLGEALFDFTNIQDLEAWLNQCHS